MTETALSILELSEQYLHKFELTRFKASKPIPCRTVLAADSGAAFCAAVARREGLQ